MLPKGRGTDLQIWQLRDAVWQGCQGIVRQGQRLQHDKLPQPGRQRRDQVIGAVKPPDALGLREGGQHRRQLLQPRALGLGRVYCPNHRVRKSASAGASKRAGADGSASLLRWMAGSGEHRTWLASKPAGISSSIPQGIPTKHEIIQSD